MVILNPTIYIFDKVEAINNTDTSKATQRNTDINSILMTGNVDIFANFICGNFSNITVSSICKVLQKLKPVASAFKEDSKSKECKFSNINFSKLLIFNI